LSKRWTRRRCSTIESPSYAIPDGPRADTATSGGAAG
jgi:hypothetical protein